MALRIAPAFLAASKTLPHPLAWVAGAAAVGYVVPTLLAYFANRGIVTMSGSVGLDSGNALYKKLAGAGKLGPAIRKHSPESDRPAVEAFAPEEQEFVVQWLNNIRITNARCRSFRRWGS